MGFVDSESGSEVEPPLLISHDEEALKPASNGKASSPLLKTPSSRSNDVLRVTKARRMSMTETEEILEELQDDMLTELYSPSPRMTHQRRSSARSTPSKSVGFAQGDAPQPDESTSLLSRTGTGRSYRDRRRRRRSEPEIAGNRSRHS
ncbi:MAG: hypothetical protein Q9183_000615, partial [Haloplaca sp. 2 TL-2023]